MATMDIIMDPGKVICIALALLIFILGHVDSVTEENDFMILSDFRDNLENPELLKWPKAGDDDDPCGPPSWPHVVCYNGRVTQIQVQSLGLKGTLPQNLNQLDKLQNLGLQRNKFSGKLPSFNGLSELQSAYLGFNEFDMIPYDFFRGLSNIRVLALDKNPFNQSSGWVIPSDLAESYQLVNFSCSGCNIVGNLPDFFGKLPSLSSLRLSYNRLTGVIPSTLSGSMLQVLWLNDQDGGGMSGSMDIISTMVGLTELWLHGNHFTGPIPDNIGDLTSLQELNLNGNKLVGLIPPSLADMNLDLLDLNNNMFMGPIPKFKSASVSYESNSFCQSEPGKQCDPTVSALLEFLDDLGYPEKLASDWKGNDPCNKGQWFGISCNSRNQVTVINLQNLDLNGTLSPSLANLTSLIESHLEGNNLHGTVSSSLTLLKFLRVLNLRGNDFDPPLPSFDKNVVVVIYDNPHFQSNGSDSSPSIANAPLHPSSSDNNQESDEDPTFIASSDSTNNQQSEKKTKTLLITVAASVSTLIALLAVMFFVRRFIKKNKTKKAPLHVSIHPNDSGNGNGKISESDLSALEAQTGGDSNSNSTTASAATTITTSDDFNKAQIIESRNLIISFQALRRATDNFAPENELGRGGFGVVCKGELGDKTNIAVKRMVIGAINEKALEEFQSEITVLSNVRHRNLVSLLGFSVEGSERLLVYEYLPRGALSRHLFQWKSLDLEPLSLNQRLSIALDVAKGVEYLHTLAHQSFIHRDLKSANILLDDEFRAKVSDFGLVKLAPDRERSVATRLAGTFGYLAPEYAVTGKITTKVDVFSFGVILMELLTGLTALDEQRTEENRYLAEWFWKIKANKASLISSIDPSLEAKEDGEDYQTISTIATLACHCTARDPSRRPDMGHVVNLLSQIVDQWRPYENSDSEHGNNRMLPLSQMLKCWQEEEEDGKNGKDSSGSSLNSEGSIPSKPLGFADSFHSNDAR